MQPQIARSEIEKARKLRAFPHLETKRQLSSFFFFLFSQRFETLAQTEYRQDPQENDT